MLVEFKTTPTSQARNHFREVAFGCDICKEVAEVQAALPVGQVSSSDNLNCRRSTGI